MRYECPLCHNETDKLLPIENPGNGYQECCQHCKQVATLIIQNYPYNQGWFNDEFPLIRLVFAENYLPFKIENEVFWGDDAKNLLKNLREALTEILINTLQKTVAIDIVVLLARLFSGLLAK